MKKKYLSKIIFALIVVAFIICCMIQAPISEAVGSLWSLLPPIVAIGLALITKEVYSSLFIGILTGGVLYSVSTSGGFPGMFKAVVQDGLIANIADSYNVGILVFLVVHLLCFLLQIYYLIPLVNSLVYISSVLYCNPTSFSLPHKNYYSPLMQLLK